MEPNERTKPINTLDRLLFAVRTEPETDQEYLVPSSYGCRFMERALWLFYQKKGGGIAEQEIQRKARKLLTFDPRITKLARPQLFVQRHRSMKLGDITDKTKETGRLLEQLARRFTKSDIRSPEAQLFVRAAHEVVKRLAEEDHRRMNEYRLRLWEKNRIEIEKKETENVLKKVRGFTIPGKGQAELFKMMLALVKGNISESKRDELDIYLKDYPPLRKIGRDDVHRYWRDGSADFLGLLHYIHAAAELEDTEFLCKVLGEAHENFYFHAFVLYLLKRIQDKNNEKRPEVLTVLQNLAEKAVANQILRAKPPAHLQYLLVRDVYEILYDKYQLCEYIALYKPNVIRMMISTGLTIDGVFLNYKNRPEKLAKALYDAGLAEHYCHILDDLGRQKNMFGVSFAQQEAHFGRIFPNEETIRRDYRKTAAVLWKMSMQS